jgi:hypothetical protein
VTERDFIRRLGAALRDLDDFADSLPVVAVKRARLALEVIQVARDTSPEAERTLRKIETWLGAAVRSSLSRSAGRRHGDTLDEQPQRERHFENQHR